MAQGQTVAPPISPTQTPQAGATRKIFVGHTIQDIYIRDGKHYGPGTVELPYGTDKDVENFNDFVKCVRRVQATREPEHRVNLDAVDTPPPKQLTQATAEELRAALAALGQSVDSVVSPANAPAEPAPIVTPAPLPITPVATQFVPTGAQSGSKPVEPPKA